MNSLSRSKQNWHLMVSVIVAAIGLHLAAFIVLGWLLLLTQEEVGAKPIEEPKPPVEINLASLEALREQIYPKLVKLPALPELEEETEKKPEKKESQMMETDGLLAREKAPEDAAFESDKNTRAASELPRSITSKDKPLPNQKGELFERSPSLRDSEFSEEQKAPEPAPQLDNQEDRSALEKRGDIDTSQPDSEPAPQQEPEIRQPESSESTKGMEPEKATDSLLPLPSEKIRPIPEEKDEPEKSLGEEETEDKVEPSKKPKKEQEPSKPEEGKEDAKAEKNQKASQAKKPRRQLQSFSSERRKSQISGSISRKGASSVDAINTPMGRYWKSISKAVETIWQREATKHRDFNMPGSLRIAFNVDKHGTVSNLRIISDAGVATIQKGYTIKAIRQAKIPSMPRDLVSEMEGEPVEMTITFNY